MPSCFIINIFNRLFFETKYWYISKFHTLVSRYSLINKYDIYILMQFVYHFFRWKSVILLIGSTPQDSQFILLLEGFLPDLLERKLATIYLFLGDTKISFAVYTPILQMPSRIFWFSVSLIYFAGLGWGTLRPRTRRYFLLTLCIISFPLTVLFELNLFVCHSCFIHQGNVTS